MLLGTLVGICIASVISILSERGGGYTSVYGFMLKGPAGALPFFLSTDCHNYLRSSRQDIHP